MPIDIQKTVTATFRGGPLDGQTRELPYPSAPLEVYAEAGGKLATGPMAIAGKTRYVLGRLDDRKRVAHYHVPTA